jgi:hypothetical protein
VITAHDLTHLLSLRFPSPGWIFLPELADHVGWDHGRKLYLADAVAFCPWPSRGLVTHGFEIKVSRSDWLRELKDPAKADGFGKYCHYWWLVVSDHGIVKDGELPDSWGLMLPTRERLQGLAKARRQNALPMDPLMFASVLRVLSSRYVCLSAFQDMLRDEFERGQRDGDAAKTAARLEELERRADRLAGQVEEHLHKAVRLARYSVQDLDSLYRELGKLLGRPSEGPGSSLSG